MPSTKPYYDAEYEVRFMLENEGTVDFYGSTLVLPQERKFASLESIQAYVDTVWKFGPVRHMTENFAVPTVVPRSGDAHAHYNPMDHTIAIPPVRGYVTWALREMVVLHEMAHAVTPTDAHGPRWAGCLVTFYQEVIGPEVGLLMRAAFDSRGVGVQMPETTIL